MEKLNITQQKHAFTNQNKCTTTQNKHKKKTNARFSRLLRHMAWKRRGPILILALHKFATYLDTYPLTYSPGTHTGPVTVSNGCSSLQMQQTNDRTNKTHNYFTTIIHANL